jgi:tRNA nucleotidyltransferase (CCA-adding enzyme)
MTALIALAGRRGEQLYLVGGSVRDLLLGRPHVDLDIAVEGDAIALAREIAEPRQGRLTAHEKFGTASVELAASRVDLARTRTESYERPGALPTVRPAGIDEDLRRRDFSVNAIALRLTPPAAGELLDPFGGRRDLEQRLVRVLHEDSFRDDATRILRAVRYEARLAFRLEDATEGLLRRDLAYLDTITGARLWAELTAIFYEDRLKQALARAQEMGILPAIYPCLRLDNAGEAALARAMEERPAPWDEVCLCLLCRHCDAPDVEALVRRLALPRRHERAIEDLVRLHGVLAELSAPDAPPSRLTETLEPFSLAPVWAVALRCDDSGVAERALLFLRQWRYVKPFLGASALRRLGVPPGRELGAALRRLRAARLDGLTSSREEEIELLGRIRE